MDSNVQSSKGVRTGHCNVENSPSAPPQTLLNIIIVGAGIAGLALAGIMGSSGHTVTVLEAAPAIGEVGAGIYCSPNLTRLLSRWGLDSYIRKYTDSLTHIKLRRWEHGEFLGAAPLMPEVEKIHGAPQYVIHRADLHRALMANAETVAEVRVNSMVTDVDFEKPCVTLSDGRVLEADLVVGADGMKSICRRLLYLKQGLVDKPRPTGNAAFRACIPLDVIEDEELRSFMTEPVANRWMGPGRHVQAYPIRHGKLYNMVMCHPDTGFSEESWTAKASKQEILDHFGSWDPVRLRKILDYVPDENVMKWRLCEHEPLHTWVVGNVVLLGDACHPMLPYVAQGAAQAIEDVAVLHLALNRISNLGDIPVLLKAYELARKPWAETIVETGGRHLARDQKFKAISQGGDNPDLLGDAKTHSFLWGHDPEHDFLENFESLIKQARHLLQSVV
ncbi:putative salicylate hydroxylase [Rhexocercosporidium sp. MPI-PUGE-AT-0058]|nr:putative salicylate hydroxylase [Rhexocercosporidium sp. MPI-PUGE-AT-0058]